MNHSVQSGATSGLATCDRKIPIDVVKGICIVGVLFAHMKFDRFTSDAREIIAGLSSGLQWCVVGFMFVSGVLSGGRLLTLHKWVQWSRKRAARLLIPCVVFSVLAKFALGVVGRFGVTANSASSLPHGAVNAILWTVEPVGPQFYFLPVLFMVSVIVKLLIVAVPINRTSTAAILSCCFGVALLLTPMKVIYGPEMLLLPLYTTAYVSGVVVAEGAIAPSVMAVIMSAFALAGSVLFGNTYLLAFPAPFILYAFCMRFESGLCGHAAAWLGRRSGALYVWHAPILMPAVSLVAVRIVRPDIQAVVVTFVGTVVLSVFMGRVTHAFRFLRLLRF